MLEGVQRKVVEYVLNDHNHYGAEITINAWNYQLSSHSSALATHTQQVHKSVHQNCQQPCTLDAICEIAPLG